MSDENKHVGRQFPTQSVVLPYTQTKGGERIEMLKGGKGYINFRTRTGTGGLGEGLFSPQNLR